jgi:hypothetical protein
VLLLLVLLLSLATRLPAPASNITRTRMHARSQAYAGKEPAVACCCQRITRLQPNCTVYMIKILRLLLLEPLLWEVTAAKPWHSESQIPWSKLPTQTRTCGIAAAVGVAAAC